MEVAEDGLRFDAETVQAERISEDADYEGVRVLCGPTPKLQSL